MSAGRRGERGDAAVEYAVIMFIISIVSLAVIVLLGPQLGDVLGTVTRTVDVRPPTWWPFR